MASPSDRKPLGRLRAAIANALRFTSYDTGLRPATAGESPFTYVRDGYRVDTTIASANQAIALHADGIARLPKCVVTVANDGTMTDQPEHAIAVLLRKPSRHMDAYMFWYLMADQMIRTGNAYAMVRRFTNGMPNELIPAEGEPQDQSPTGEIIYTLRPLPIRIGTRHTHEIRGVPASEVVAISWREFDGRKSPSPIAAHARDVLATMDALTTRNRAAATQGFGARSVIQTDAELTKVSAEQREQLRDELHKSYASAENEGKLMVLPPGFTVNDARSFSAVDMEIVSLLKWSVEEVSRIFNVPPRMLHHFAEGTRLTGAAFEQQSEDFVRWCVKPNADRFTCQLTEKLLRPMEMHGMGMRHEVQFITDDIRAGAFSDRMKAAGEAVKSGLLTQNEARARLKYNRIDDPDYDKLLQPQGAPKQDQADGGKMSPDDNPDDGDES